MKTFFVVAAVACLAIISVEISQSNAQRGGWRCPGVKPKISPVDEVQCDNWQGLVGGWLCKRRCRDCYKPSELAPARGCLANRTCVCLGKKNNSTTETTVAPTTEISVTTALPTSVSPSSTSGGEETTQPGVETTLPSEATTVAEPVPDVLCGAC